LSKIDSTGYLSSHLALTKRGLGYTRSSYAKKAWLTYGRAFPADRRAVICEIGPGECEFAEFLRDQQGYQAIRVVDTSPEVVAKASTVGLAVELTGDTSGWLERHHAIFDAIVMFHVIEHIPKSSTIAFLAAVRRALKPGGVVLLETPNMGDPLNGLYYRYDDFTHEVGFTEESLRYVFKQAGFSECAFIDAYGATSSLGRPIQKFGRHLLKGLLFALNLPNGRQMRRRLGPVLAMRATP
jgi:SAM-dependent methyltransferase